MNVCVYGASSNKLAESYLTAGRAMGRAIADRGWGMVYGGGGNGMMGAAARGMTDGGGTIIGVVPSFLQVDGVLYDACTEMIYTDNLRDRKQVMDDRSDAFVILAGGVGTFDEFFEVLTLRQLGRHARPIGLLNTNGYFEPLLELLRHAVAEGFVKQSVLSYLQVSEDPEELLTLMERHLGETPKLDKDLG